MNDISVDACPDCQNATPFGERCARCKELHAITADRDRLFDAAVIAAELIGAVECNLDLQDRPSKTLGVVVVKLADALRAMTTREWKPNG